MTDYQEEVDSKLCMVVRKPQEGKTFICIASIKCDNTDTIHLVLAMNTLSAGSQFVSRIENNIGSQRVIVFNSKPETAGDCHHAKHTSTIFKLLRENPGIKVIICCANEKRFNDSIPDMLALAGDMPKFANRKFAIHIDEAHKYIRENRERVRTFNNNDLVCSITGYSGSPDPIWSNDKDDSLFHSILIRDVDKELELTRSTEYFGVKDCEHIVNIGNVPLLDEIIIPAHIIQMSKMTPKQRGEWYSVKFPFDIGNEHLFLSYIDMILPTMKVDNDTYSYNFIPAYTRKATHYAIKEIILKHYTNANVIVINGDGIVLFRINQSSGYCYATTSSDTRLLEPSDVIQTIIKENRNCPTFVTGLQCVGMSVSLINPELGNFDNAVLSHSQFSIEKLYQLCRFLFNPKSWPDNKKLTIKKTKLYTLTPDILDICLRYEQHVQQISTEFAGLSKTIYEINGSQPTELTEREIKKKCLSDAARAQEGWKKFKVYDGNDIEEWGKCEMFYIGITAKKLNSITKPKLVDGFYNCSTTKKRGLLSNYDIVSQQKTSWSSLFQLVSGKFSYARLFVGYDDMNDASEYTIYIKYVVLVNDIHNTNMLALYGKKSINGENVSECTSSSDDE